jgi:hypothetical protein
MMGLVSHLKDMLFAWFAALNGTRDLCAVATAASASITSNDEIIGWSARCSTQHVTWMIALVSSGSSGNTSMALIVGRISNLTL